MPESHRTIIIHASAPTKPAQGDTCNGCGVCCAMEPCPVSLALLRTPANSRCGALEWRDDVNRYVCGMVMHPKQYLRIIPQKLEPLAKAIFKRWIAADQACDADITLTDT